MDFESMSKEEKVAILSRIGGKRWQRGDVDRVYFGRKALYDLLKIERTYSTSGELIGVTVDGETWSLARGEGLLETLDGAKVYYDLVFREWGYRVTSYKYEGKVKTVMELLEKQTNGGASVGANNYEL